MAHHRPASTLSVLLDAIDQAYDHPAWHGPNLRGSIRRVTPEQAIWRPAAGRKCIGEIVVHAAYWKYVVRRRLMGAKRGAFALRGSNWFDLEAPWTKGAWKGCRMLLDEEHRALREVIEAWPVDQLLTKPKGSRVSALAVIHGIALHDVYHAGQIQLIKRSMENEGSRKRS